jgi:endonuclease/exonuclease/phosphatase family metal-dependent hydrolase
VTTNRKAVPEGIAFLRYIALIVLSFLQILKSMKHNKYNLYHLSRLEVSIVTLFLLLSFFQAGAQQSEKFRICTFNIQNFGKTKLNDSLRVHQLAEIIRKYDIIAIQEISDVSGAVPGAFKEIINRKGKKHFEVACSERTGEQPDDRTSREQYAFYYDTVMFALMGTPMLYNDSLHDFFAREPYTARFRSKKGDFTFVLATIHTAPEKAVSEIGSLHEVVKWVKEKYTDETEIIVLGDFNASCTYANPGELDQLSIRGKDYFWVVPDTAKTNLSAKSDCAYDRFVLTLPAKKYYSGRWGVDKSFTSKTISDHWPVWAEFNFVRNNSSR